MRRRLVIILIALVGCIFAGQQCNAQFRYGPTAGVNYSTVKFKQKLFNIDSSIGYSAGLATEMMFPGIGFGLDFGLQYNQTGSTLHLGERPIWAWEGYKNPHIYMHNLYLPIHLRFKYTRLGGMEEIFAPFAYAGPEFQIQLAHNKCEAINFSGGDLGIGFGLGAELYKHWQVSLSWTWGMTYVMKTQMLENYSAKCSYWGLHVTYFIK